MRSRGQVPACPAQPGNPLCGVVFPPSFIRAFRRLTEMSESICEDKVREQLKQVIDPELFVNIVDLGLVYTVNLAPNAEDATKTDVGIEMTMTSPMCPAGPQLVGNSRQVLEALENVGKVDVKVVMDPPWTQDRMTEDARDQLGIF